nr:hypothetical protein [uncultured Anaerostipes sp.]
MSIFDEINQMHESISSRMTDMDSYEIPEDAVFPSEIISEKIDELGDSIKKPLDRQVEAIESIANSAKVQSDIAVKTSKKADIKGWISVIVALLAFLLELSERLGLF